MVFIEYLKLKKIPIVKRWEYGDKIEHPSIRSMESVICPSFIKVCSDGWIFFAKSTTPAYIGDQLVVLGWEDVEY